MGSEESDGNLAGAARVALEAGSNVFEGEVIAQRRPKAYEAQADRAEAGGAVRAVVVGIIDVAQQSGLKAGIVHALR